MEDYYKEMEITMMNADLQEDLEVIMTRFLNGMRPNITEMVEVQHYMDMNEMLDKVVKVEKCLKRRAKLTQTLTIKLEIGEIPS